MAVLGPDEKNCPMCAETVKAAAARCRFCGHDFSRAATIAPSKGEKVADAVGGGMMKFGLIGLGLILMVAFCSRSGDVAETGADTAATVAAAPAPEPVSPDVRKECGASLAKAEQAGLVRKAEPNLRRLTVDEHMWREVGPDNRVALMAFAACDWYGAKFSALQDGQVVTIIGWQSGDRLASSMGGLYRGD